MADHALVTRLPHLQAQLVYAALFRDVKNSAFLRQQLLESNTDFEYAFLDATSVIHSSSTHRPGLV
jgi:EKC/KEOPS complex subunit CGI121/TPRKB